MSTLNSSPYKGTRDWYPEDFRKREYVFSKWREVCQRYGYEGYDTPLLEPIEVYMAKSGQELVGEQTYQFMDRGDRSVAIRPEMTPSVSRMVAGRRQELAYPLRWYSIAQFMRYERPQRGREREFWQLNVDIFGADNMHAEAEIISMGAEFLSVFGARDDMYTIRINNRKVINFMMAHYLGLDAAQAQLMVKLFDRKNKIAPEAFRDQATEIFGEEVAAEGLRKITELMAAKSFAELPEAIRDSASVREVQQLFTLLERAGIKNAIFDITLMRGLDYYTGTVFEFFDTHPENNRSMYGGGRYDGLVGLFGGEGISAVGVAPGLSMMLLFLESHKLLPAEAPADEVYMVVLGDSIRGANALARELRAGGVNVEVDFTGRKFDKQLKTALKKNVKYILFVGESELETKVYPLKDTVSGEELKLTAEQIVSRIVGE